ncbi:hypothetical protein E1293_07585 [Actinomadura darangshiensis]|uniref:Uncharacterized protein n=1 Tax=Actinomadura darangshiensis TaxID=705336 RepID=A0A4R5BLH0_9ACTN|nr:hypothetical protein [Actinomadura darangshiensis]TDD87668.1 hypothetical protein E1293_07585 [Actinomadura darangshiensis]
MPEPVVAAVRAMARREAAAALLPAPRVEFGAEGPSVRVNLVACPVCGAPEQTRAWAPPFKDAAGPDRSAPVLHMLACEMLTIRAVLPIVVAAVRSPGLAGAQFNTRALTWLEVSHLQLEKALEAVDTAEANGRTLAASTRPYRPAEVGWTGLRRDLVPSFLSPHADVPDSLERLYAETRGAGIVANYQRICETS